MSLTIRHESVRCPGSGGGLRLAHLSDLHVRWSSKRLDEVRDILGHECPDVVVFTGDWFDTPRGAQLCTAFLQQVAAVRPVCWISGNHDHWHGCGPLEALRSVPGAFCVDDAPWSFETADGHRIEFMSWRSHLSAPPRERGLRVVLLHNPEDIDAARLAGCDLLLAGHLHGGQFIFRRHRDGSFFPGNLLYRWCRDRCDVHSTTIIISRGLGDTLPLRFRCPHEVVMVTLE
jgi:predicted MPP superfamily phosphohydrolase